MRIAPGVDGGELWRTDIGDDFAVGHREIENGKIAMLMPHRRAQRQLHIDHDRCDNRNSNEDADVAPIEANSKKYGTKICGNERDDDEGTEIRLREAGVKNSDLIFQQSDAQTTEHALQNNRGERGVTEIAHPATRFGSPKPNGQNDGEKSDCGSDEPMGVFEKNSADPFAEREKKHVVAESGRPIRHGESDAFARYHSAAANEEERRDRREPGEAIQPLTVAAF